MIRSIVKPVQTLMTSGVIVAIFFGSSLVFAQADVATISKNIQPIGQVCLAGQGCSGNSAGATGNSGTAPVAASSPAPATATPSAQPAATPVVATFDAAATYQQSCFACHGSGAAGAPVFGDSEAWDARMANGIDTVLANAINGIGAMPAKGMCMTCTEDDMRTLIDYMVTGGQ